MPITIETGTSPEASQVVQGQGLPQSKLENGGDLQHRSTEVEHQQDDNSFWESDQDEEQPLHPTGAVLESEPSDQPLSCCDNNPAALLILAPIRSIWSTAWNNGMICMAFASAIQAYSALLVKLTNERVPIFEIVVVRSTICMLSTLVVARMQGIRNIFGNMKYFIPMFIRGLAGAISMSVYYYAVFKLPLSDMVTLFFTHPAMIVILAWIVKGEMVRWPGLVGILASMIGTMIVSRPPFLLGGEHWTADHLHGVIACLLAAFLAAVAFIAIRFIPKTEPSICIATWFHFLGVVTAGLPLAAGLPSWPVLPSWNDSFCVLGVGLCSFTSHIFIARSLQIEIAAKASAAGYLQVVFAYGFGLAFLGEGVETWSVVGSLVICLGVVATSWPSKKSGGAIEGAGLPVTNPKTAEGDVHESELVPLADPQVESDAVAKIVVQGHDGKE